MLIDQNRLALALNDFEARDDLIRQLDLSGREDKNRFYKLVLAFWLGASTNAEKIGKDPSFKQCYSAMIYIGFYCILALDKQISLLADKPSVSRNMLCRARLRLMICYNENYHLLKEDANKLVLLFETIIHKIDSQCIQSSDKSIVENAKRQCLAELSRLSLSSSDMGAPTQEVSRVSNDNASLSVFANKVITENFERHVFYRSVSFDSLSKDYLIHKIVIPANDGILLDGLYVKKRHTSSKNIILALIGHFQSEHSYVARSLIDFQKLFDTDVVFINHRNYSSRAAKFASSIDDLAGDVVSFVHHFKRQNKNIVLYGMCGGAAHMIVAASMLMKDSIHFKLIVDRFSRKYIDFMDFKTLKRHRAMAIEQSSISSDFLTAIVKSDLAMCIVVPIVLLFLLIFKMLLYLTKTDIDFSKIIRLIPEEDLLVLQAKSKKQHQKNEALLTDFYVHPENDMRTAIKDRRHKNKIILKNLHDNCLKIASAYARSEPMQSLFLDLSVLFDNGIKLIDDEKLTMNIKGSGVSDLHTRTLYGLTTRNNLALKPFLGGFFAQPVKACNDNLAALRPYSFRDILQTIQAGHLTIRNDLSDVATYLSCFLRELKYNEKFICHLANRLWATGLGDINEPIQKLLKSDLFQQLSAIPLEARASNGFT